MNTRTANLLLAAFIVVTLASPMIAGTGLSTPSQAEQSSTVVAMVMPRIGAIEAIVTEVDAWGGVTTVVAALENVTHYGNEHVESVADVIENQMATEDGYVGSLQFSLNGLTPYPNGVVGPPIAVLQLTVEPVVIVPVDKADAYLEELTVSEATTIADEVAAVYEAELSINLERMILVNSTSYTYFDYGISGFGLYGLQYIMTYVDALTVTTGETSVAAYRAALADMGGFMSLVGAPDWPDLLTTSTEVIGVSHWLPDYYGPSSFMAMSLPSYTGDNYVRANAVHTDLVETTQVYAIAQASFTEPGVVEAVTGDETYAIADHLGYTSNIQSKMTQDPSCESISAILGASPGSLDIERIPSDWLTFSDDYQIPVEVDIPYGPTLPANTTVSEIIRSYLSYLPIEYAYEINYIMGGFDPTDLDDYVDYIWDAPWPSYPNGTEEIMDVDFTEIDTSVLELNLDLLAELMANAGMTPSALVSRIDNTAFAEDPIRGLAMAFFDYFDYYHMFELFDNDTYPYLNVLEDYFSTFGDGLKAFLKDFGGIDMPTEFSTKAELAAFMDEHWGIVLQGLFTAMANNSTAEVKTALHGIFDPTNAQEHITPYLMADLGVSLAAGIGFFGGVNFNETLALFGLDASDIVLAFDSDPESLSLDGPYVVVTKAVLDRTVNVGDTVNFTITAANYGNTTAYNVKILDGMSAGLDGEREFYWTRSTLAAGDSWTITYLVEAVDGGLYMDFPALCVYFNASLSAFDPADPETWGGTARYTTSARGYQIQVGSGSWLDGTILGIPTLYVVAGVGGIGVIGIAILLVRRR